MATRKIGVEEELLLVDPETGVLAAVSGRAMQEHAERVVGAGAQTSDDIEQELFLQQIETGTAPTESASALAGEIRRCREAAGVAARRAGAAAVAVSTPVLGHPEVATTPNARYERIVAEFGEIGRQGVVCGMHVHVDVAGDDEAVAVIDRIRPWLPVLLALSANSPYWRGIDTGYASWRAQTWGRWPAAGPAEPYGDVATYRAVADEFIETGAALDRGMLYYDARLSDAFTTVELRVADVCTEVDDAVLVAALGRALVETAARDWADGRATPHYRSDLLTAARWRASRYGLSERLVDPVTRALAPARQVVEAMIRYVGRALDEAGDTGLVCTSLERMLARGPGATRQRAVAEAKGDLAAVVADLVERTEASWHAG